MEGLWRARLHGVPRWSRGVEVCGALRAASGLPFIGGRIQACRLWNMRCKQWVFEDFRGELRVRTASKIWVLLQACGAQTGKERLSPEKNEEVDVPAFSAMCAEMMIFSS